MQFKVTYKDNSVFIGKVIPDCDWGKLTDHTNIKFLEFAIHDNVYTFHGFKEYNIKLERIQVGVSGISKIFVFARGKKESLVLSFFRNQLGQLLCNKNVTDVKHEYGNLVISDWRNGVSDEPFANVRNIRTNVHKDIYNSVSTS